VLGDATVIGDEAGLFLATTWRLHPSVCAFTSEAFYDGRLEAEPSLTGQLVVGTGVADGTGLRWLPVAHDGDRTESVAEAEVIADLVSRLLASEARWTNRDGETRPLGLQDVVIVAPYNAHVERIARSLADRGHPTARVGTVDKFQGQEAPISIYAMATSTAEEAPRGLEFLYSRNRLNVATSRASCVAIVVASRTRCAGSSRWPPASSRRWRSTERHPCPRSPGSSAGLAEAPRVPEFGPGKDRRTRRRRTTRDPVGRSPRPDVAGAMEAGRRESRLTRAVDIRWILWAGS
jgi:hypothetical protein